MKMHNWMIKYVGLFVQGLGIFMHQAAGRWTVIDKVAYPLCMVGLYQFALFQYGSGHDFYSQNRIKSRLQRRHNRSKGIENANTMIP